MKIMDREAPPSPEESDGEEYWEDRSHLPPFFDPGNPEATEWEIPEGPFADFLARDDVLGNPDGSWYERTRENILEEVARAMAENFYDPGADLTPHSLDAVINGNQDLEHTKDLGLKMNKSPGYPWSKAGPKSAYFVERPNSDGERKFYDPDMTKKEFWERVQERDDLAQQGV